MTQPVSGITDFNNLSGSLISGGVTPVVMANNVAGWDFSLTNPSSVFIGIGSLPITGQTKLIEGRNNSGQAVGTLTVSPDDGSTFTLNAVDVTMGEPSVGVSGLVVLQGYRGDNPVAGATLSLLVTDAYTSGHVVTFDVSSNPHFAGVTAFSVTTDGTYTVTAIGVDNINATNYILPPIVTPSVGSAAFVSADNAVSAPVPVDAGLTVTGATSPTLASGTVSITAGFQPGRDLLRFTNDGSTQGNIAGSYDAATGVLTLISAGATATIAEWEAALRTVAYTDIDPVPDTTTRTISFAVDSGSALSAIVMRDISVTATPQSPIVTPSAGITVDPAPATPLPVDAGLIVSDRDSETLASAIVAITGNFHPGEDVLGFVNTGAQDNIAGSYDAGTGVLTLTSTGATATLAEWQAALRAVTYVDTATPPHTAPRVISFAVNDGGLTSAVADHTIGAAISSQTTSIYRFFDSATGTHFFTTSLDEKNAITDPNSPGYQPAFVAESNGFTAVDPAANDPDAVAVYRFFDTATGAHFMTSSASERDDIMNPASADYHANYIAEPGATFYEHATQQAGDVAVYRLFDTNDGTHFYTSDAAEFAGITNAGDASYRPNLIPEGVAFYAPSGSAG